jgi:hypothetical protein
MPRVCNALSRMHHQLLKDASARVILLRQRISTQLSAQRAQKHPQPAITPLGVNANLLPPIALKKEVLGNNAYEHLSIACSNLKQCRACGGALRMVTFHVGQ